MADRYSERAPRWEDSERRFRDRDRESSYDRGFLERFADEMRSWFGNEEAQRRRMMDEREDWRSERGSDWGWRDRGRDWSREWPRAESSRSSSEWMRGPDERQWSRDWGWIEGRGPSGSSYGSSSYGSGYGSGGYGSSGYGVSGFGGYGAWGRERDWGRPERESRDYGARDFTSMGGPHSGRGPRNYQRSDERIREEVCELLTKHSYVDASDVDIRVQNGQVTLDGSVSDRRAKRTAEDLAESVWGVTEVQNRLRVVQSELGADQRIGQDQREGRHDQPGTGPQRGTWAA